MSDNLDEFTRAYLEAALWSSLDESTPSGGDPLDANYTADDIAPESLATMKADCEKFQRDNHDLLRRAYAAYPLREWAAQAWAGHDFWLTRNGHGAGFWDGDLPDDIGDALTDACKAYPQVDLYVGDDQAIYA